MKTKFDIQSGFFAISLGIGKLPEENNYFKISNLSNFLAFYL